MRSRPHEGTEAPEAPEATPEGVASTPSCCTSCVTRPPFRVHSGLLLARQSLPGPLRCAKSIPPFLAKWAFPGPDPTVRSPHFPNPQACSLVVHLCTSWRGALLCIQCNPEPAASTAGRWAKAHIRPAHSYISLSHLSLARLIYRNCATSANIAAHVSLLPLPFASLALVLMTNADEAVVAVGRKRGSGSILSLSDGDAVLRDLWLSFTKSGTAAALLDAP